MSARIRRPIENSYVVPGTRLVAGEYPGKYPGKYPSAGAPAAAEKLQQYLDAGIRAFIDLTQPEDRLEPYVATLRELAGEQGVQVSWERFGIRDVSTCEPDHMRRILDTIDARLAEGYATYVHCWGGVGRTGMVVGCWLVRQGRDGEEALRHVQELFGTVAKSHRHRSSPETDAQREVVRTWATYERGE